MTRGRLSLLRKRKQQFETTLQAATEMDEAQIHTAYIIQPRAPDVLGNGLAVGHENKQIRRVHAVRTETRMRGERHERGESSMGVLQPPCSEDRFP